MNKQILRNVVFIGLFLVPFVPFLVSSSFFFPFITTKAFTWRVIVEIIFAAWLLLALTDASYRPKKTPVLYAVLAFLAVIGLADLFGASPLKSFWSNFERMEGYVTLLHLGAFFVVIGSIFGERDWKRWWNTSLVASLLMVFYCLFQIAGVVTINQGGVRVDGTLGNAIYLAVYMLFHIFIALLFMLREWKNTGLRFLYGILILLQSMILYFTATRGAMLGLIGGILILALLNVRNREEKVLRKLSISLLVFVVAVLGAFYLARNSSFVAESPVLSRFATLNLSELKTQGRYFIWPMAWEGFKDRPILGWGQENFSFVFQEHYRPEMFRLEPWFDRAHNIFLDWMVAGGIVGLFFYLSLYCAALYLIWKNSFSHMERSVLTALLAAYFFHNFFVFDHLVSYALFFSLLAYLHFRSNAEPLWKNVVSEGKVKTLAMPLVALGLLATLYFVNWKPVIANTALIRALQAVQFGQLAQVSPQLEKAFNASLLGRTEVVEQAAAQAPALLGSNLSVEEKNAYYIFAVKAIEERSRELENDARYHMMSGSFFSSMGNFAEALAHLNKAVELMPQKQMMHFELGAVYINQKDNARALAAFKTAYDMAPEYPEAKIIYLVGAIYAGDHNLEERLLNELSRQAVAFDERIVSAYYVNGRIDRVLNILNERKILDPGNAATYDGLLKQLQTQN